jgi:hypothetical protein
VPLKISVITPSSRSVARNATLMPLNSPLKTTPFPLLACAATVSSNLGAATPRWCTPSPFSARKRA